MDPQATAKVHPHLINWKTYGLVWKEPAWTNAEPGYDPLPVLKRLRELDFAITLTPHSMSDKVEGFTTGDDDNAQS